MLSAGLSAPRSNSQITHTIILMGFFDDPDTKVALDGKSSVVCNHTSDQVGPILRIYRPGVGI